jgi:acyl-CoA thioesterase-1
MRLPLNLKNLNQRHFIAIGALLAMIGLTLSPPFQNATAAPIGNVQKARTILVLGDSLSAEYGLKRGSGWVALLEQKLKAENVNASVVNASISGDTTSGGRARLPALLAQHQPTQVIIELGGNDALRGAPLSLTQNNLIIMTQTAQQASAKVLLIGMQVPPNYGRDYGLRFAALYASVAKSNHAALVPFLLKGIADRPDSMQRFQADGIHPKEEAHPLMLANIWPELKKILQ